MITRSILGLLYISKIYDDLGINTRDVFKKHGLPIEHIDENASIDRSKELEVVIDLYRLKPLPNLGLIMGSQMGLAGYGPFSMLLMTCGNAYEACQIGIRYQDLTYLYSTINVDLGPEESAIVLSQTTIPEEVAEFLLYRDMAGSVKFIRDIQNMNGVPFDIKQVELTCKKPDSMEGFKEAFGCPVLFNQKENRVIALSKFFTVPYTQANKMAFNIYREQCDQQLIKWSNIPDNVGTQLAQYLKMFSYRLPTVVEAANTFGFSERTFRRQLASENTSFQKVLDSVRFERAKSLLEQSQLNIDAIAEKLGYQEAAAFNHAFKRWADITPSQYRKNHSLKI